jgi:hypothetical protein
MDTKNAFFFLPLVLWFSMPSSLSAQSGHPKFSWDRVPLYVHVGLGKGLKPEEYKLLAERCDFIAFTGGVMDREYRTNDAITFETIVTDAATTVKQHNPKAKILFYWAAEFAKPHNKISNALIPADGQIEVKRNSRNTVQLFDTTNPEVRDWWTDIAAKAMREYGCDGIFVDGGTAFRPGTVYETKLGKERNGALECGTMQMMREAKLKMGEDSIILLNPLHGFQGGEQVDDAIGWRYLPVFDGAMIDDFDRAANIVEKRQSPEYIANTIKIMTRAAKQGEIVVFKAWPGFTWWSDKELIAKPYEEQYQVAADNLEFPLACFLVGAEENCYFCYSWGWVPEHGALAWYPEFDKRLGSPKGDGIQKGWKFAREFEHASVFVDVEKRTGKIDWR